MEVDHGAVIEVDVRRRQTLVVVDVQFLVGCRVLSVDDVLNCNFRFMMTQTCFKAEVASSSGLMQLKTRAVALLFTAHAGDLLTLRMAICIFIVGQPSLYYCLYFLLWLSVCLINVFLLSNAKNCSVVLSQILSA